jgi:hypothetical protein
MAGRGREPLNPNYLLEGRIAFRVGSHVKRELERRAASHQMTLTEYLRGLVARDLDDGRPQTTNAAEAMTRRRPNPFAVAGRKEGRHGS